MSITQSRGTTRRTFLYGVSALAAGVSLIRPAVLIKDSGKAKIWDEPTDEELRSLRDSFMAPEIVKIIDKKYSCSESILLASLRYLEKPDELVHAAGSFGGGLHQGDLCGFLTGAHMAIGFASGMKFPDNRKKFREFEKKKSKAFWDWWSSYATLHCYLLKERIPCKNPDNFRLAAQRVAARLEPVLAQAKG